MADDAEKSDGDLRQDAGVSPRVLLSRGIAEDVIRLRCAGEFVFDAEVLARHVDLLPEIEIELRNVARVELAKRIASGRSRVVDDLAGRAG